MSDITIRPATIRDAGTVTALLEASYPVLMAPAYDATVLAPALELMCKAQPGLLASGTYYVAESKDGDVIGCGGWTKERPGDGVVKEGTAHLRHFGTRPGWIRHGVGRALYERCEADARNAGVDRFECYSSLNAEAFYAALGFEPIERIELPLSLDVILSGVHMQRRI